MASKPDTIADQLRNNAVTIKQTIASIAEAQRLRTDAVAAGAFDLVKRHEKRIADLESDKRALSEHRVILARQAAEADLAERVRLRDEAIGSEVTPRLEAVCAAVVAFERQLEEAAASYAQIVERHNEYKRAWPKAVPPMPVDQEFTLDMLGALVKQALRMTLHAGDFENIMYRFGEERPSEAMRRRLTAFIAELKSVELPARKPLSDEAA